MKSCYCGITFGIQGQNTVTTRVFTAHFLHASAHDIGTLPNHEFPHLSQETLIRFPHRENSATRKPRIRDL